MRLHRDGLWIVLLLGVGGVGCDSKRSAPLALGGPRTANQRELQGTDAGAVGGKCDEWGYSVVTPDDGRHSACVAMGIADYCGNGQAHTVSGTLIDFYDQYPVADGGMGINDLPDMAPATPPTFYFEAAWVPGQQTCRGRRTGHALCLSKKRWSTIPLGGPCPAILADPRVDRNARYCEDLASDGSLSININDLELLPAPAALANLKARGALLFNYSADLDRALRQWSNGTYYALSTDGAVDYPMNPGGYTLPAALMPTANPPPPAPTAYTPSPSPLQSVEGVAFTQDFIAYLQLRGVTSPPLVKLVTYRLASGGFVTTTQVSTGPCAGPASCTWVRDEGYVFTVDPTVPGNLPSGFPQFTGQAQPLLRYVTGSGASTRYLTTTAPPPLAGFGTPQPEGYVLVSL